MIKQSLFIRVRKEKHNSFGVQTSEKAWRPGNYEVWKGLMQYTVRSQSFAENSLLVSTWPEEHSGRKFAI